MGDETRIPRSRVPVSTNPCRRAFPPLCPESAPDIVPVSLCPINWRRLSEPASQLANVGAGAYDFSPFLGAVYARDGDESKCKGIVFDEVLVIDDCLFLADMAHGEGMWDGNRREAR